MLERMRAANGSWRAVARALQARHGGTFEAWLATIYRLRFRARHVSASTLDKLEVM